MEKLIQRAYVLSLITIFYNVIEGLLSVYYGSTDETLALFGFGIDSFVEVISGIGIAHMVLRMKKADISQRDKFERKALKITGISFYILTIGLLAGALLSFMSGKQPVTTLAGVVISSISIATMYFLMTSKKKVGKALNSDAIISDANCTKTCLILSVILLISSLGYQFAHIPYIDTVGSLGIAYYSFSEGKEAFEKAKSEKLSCSCTHCKND